MAEVTGNARFFTGLVPQDSSLELMFVPSGPGFDGAGSYWGPTKYVIPDNQGNFAVQLQATTTLFPHVWFELGARWRTPHGKLRDRKFPGWRVEVPPAGGDISDLITATGFEFQGIWIGPHKTGANPPEPETPIERHRFTGWIDNSIPVPADGMPYYEWE